MDTRFNLYRTLRGLIIFLAVIAVTTYQEVQSVQLQSNISLQATSVQPEAKSRNVFAKPKVGAKQILFVETSCSAGNVYNGPGNESIIRLDATQACAIESAAKYNPKTPIFLYHSCFLDNAAKSLARSSPMVQNIFNTYDNVFIWHESFESLVNNTEMEEFYQSGRLLKSKYLSVHTSDIARLMLLGIYGGIYLDLDFIITKDLSPLASDFVALESDNYANAAALAFKHEGVGNKLVTRWLKEIRDTFTGQIDVQTGPGALSHILPGFCHMDRLRPTATPEECGGLVIYPPTLFYPIPWQQWKNFYTTEPSLRDKAMASTKDTYGVHLYAAMRRLTNVEEEYREFDRNHVNHPKAILQQRHCPLAFAGKSFN